MSMWNRQGVGGVLLALCLAAAAGCGDKATKNDNIDDLSTGEILPDGAAFSKTKAYIVQMDPSTGLVPTQFQSIRLIFTDAHGKPAAAVADVTLKPWMTSMNHGTATKKLQLAPVEGRPDVIAVTNLWFTMGGPWDLLLSATVNDVADDAVLPVEVAR